jgi:hypothetical protein
MDTSSHDHKEIAADLKATLAARRDLGPEMDDELVELFLARVDRYIDAQLTHQVVPRPSKVPSPPPRPHSVANIPPSLAAWQGFVALGLCLLFLSIVFGAHVHAFPPVAIVILLAVSPSRRGWYTSGGSRRT